MKPFVLAALAAITLAACATVVNETNTDAVIERGFNAGERYTIRTRTMEGSNGTYVTTSVVYRGMTRTCILDSPRDCATAADRLIDSFDDSLRF